MPPVLSRRAFLRGRLTTVEETGGPAIACVDARACLGSSLQVCTSCIERCGARGALRLAGLTPVVLADRCTGCGECVRVCPAPIPALRLVSARARKEAP